MRVGEALVPARLGRSFRWLLASSWVSNLGDGMALAAGPLLVAMPPWATTSTSVRQRAVPMELQGRVSSVYLLGVQGGLVIGGFAGSAALVVALWRQLAHVVYADVTKESGSLPGRA